MAEAEVYPRRSPPSLAPHVSRVPNGPAPRGEGQSTPQSSLEDALRCAARNGAVALVHELLSEGAIIDRDEVRGSPTPLVLVWYYIFLKT